MGLGYILGGLFTNSSGHPARLLEKIVVKISFYSIGSHLSFRPEFSLVCQIVAGVLADDALPP
jgi:hypothetical protein